MRSHCNIHCRTATTPRSECECRCGGDNHGTTATVVEFGTVAIEEDAQLPRTNPFESLSITEQGGVEARTKTERLSKSAEYGLDNISVGDRVDVCVEYADDGWQLHHKLTVEDVRDEGVTVTQPDGFVAIVPPTQIPAGQFA